MPSRKFDKNFKPLGIELYSNSKRWHHALLMGIQGYPKKTQQAIVEGGDVLEERLHELDEKFKQGMDWLK